MSDPWIQQICFLEVYRPVPQWNAEILKQAACQVVDDSYMRTAFDKGID
jgi:hypothetical protein